MSFERVKIAALFALVLMLSACPKKGETTDDHSTTEDQSTPTDLPLCAQAGQIHCIANSNFPAFSASEREASMTSLTADNLVEALQTDAPFQFWDAQGKRQVAKGSSLLSSTNIKQGVTIFGATGTLTAAELVCQHTTQAQCEADKACQWVNGDCSVDPWNIRAGTSIAGTSGQLKTACRNRANSAIFNTDAMPPGSSGDTSGGTIHWWDTIDDLNGDGAFPSSLVAGWSADTDCDRNVWCDLTADGACDAAADDCLMQDRISGLIWSESYPAAGVAAGSSMSDWSTAVSRCDGLSYGGYSDWRLPTQKELQAASMHGVRDLGYKGTGTIRALGTLDNNNAFIASVDGYYWSSSSVSINTANAWDVYLDSGFMTTYDKTQNHQVLCVRP